jgi:hypothetical protein
MTAAVRETHTLVNTLSGQTAQPGDMYINYGALASTF